MLLVRLYALRHRLGHLVASQEWRQVTELIAQWDFLQQYAKHFGAFALYGVIAEIDQSVATAPIEWQVKLKKQRDMLKEMADLLIDIKPVAPHYQVPTLWEGELSYEQVTVEQVFNKILTKSAGQRLMVLGSTGTGKTELLRYLAWMAGWKHLKPIYVRLAEWEQWTVLRRDYTLSNYISSQYLFQAGTIDQWAAWLRAGDILLLFDGLDEIVGHQYFIKSLHTTLITLHCPAVMTCRTKSSMRYIKPCPNLRELTLPWLESSQIYAYVRAKFPDRYHAEKLIAGLSRVSLLPLCSNPMLLSYICHAIDDPNVSLPFTFTALYERMIQQWLNRPGRRDVHYPHHKPPLMTRQRLLEKTALHLFAKHDGSAIFRQKDLWNAMEEALHTEGYGKAPALTQALMADLIHNTGILEATDEHYFFLHLNVYELLVAAALAHMIEIERQGWRTQIRLTGTAVRVSDFINSKAREPRWESVLLYLKLMTNETPRQTAQRSGILTRISELWRGAPGS